MSWKRSFELPFIALDGIMGAPRARVATDRNERARFRNNFSDIRGTKSETNANLEIRMSQTHPSRFASGITGKRQKSF
jgi:hypothetical protein